MKNMFKFLSFSLLVILVLSGCNINNGEEDNIFKYKDSYVGDANAVGNILNQLQGEHFKGFELKTTEEPYGIIANYDWADSEQNYKKTAIYNATYLFILIQNADWVTFNFDNQEYKITKDELQNWYGKNLSGLQSEDELKTLTQKYLDDEDKVNRLFH